MKYFYFFEFEATWLSYGNLVFSWDFVLLGLSGLNHKMALDPLYDP